MGHSIRLPDPILAVFQFTVFASFLSIPPSSILLIVLYRALAEDYEKTKHRVLEKQSSLDSNKSLCPICAENEIGQMSRQNACADCERIVCQDCGEYQLNPKTKVCTNRALMV